MKRKIPFYVQCASFEEAESLAIALADKLGKRMFVFSESFHHVMVGYTAVFVARGTDFDMPVYSTDGTLIREADLIWGHDV